MPTLSWGVDCGLITIALAVTEWRRHAHSQVSQSGQVEDYIARSSWDRAVLALTRYSPTHCVRRPLDIHSQLEARRYSQGYATGWTASHPIGTCDGQRAAILACRACRGRRGRLSVSQDAVTTAQPQRSPDATGMTQTMYYGFSSVFNV